MLSHLKKFFLCTHKKCANYLSDEIIPGVKVGVVDTDQLLNKLRALCTKLDAPALPASIEEAQEVLRK